ncbi:MAG: hypothetical protein EOP51_03150 [Sphingobacteriales bacterium]|nr:MAG: hypothetical protein EOP51_03150 [Sphingobacteriales bacterium]
MKVTFTPTTTPKAFILDIEDAYIPFTLTAKRNYLEGVIYNRNMDSQNLIEFRFGSDSKELIDVNSVMLKLMPKETAFDGNVQAGFFNCKLDQEEGVESTFPAKSYVGSNFIEIVFMSGDENINYYPVHDKFLIAADSQGVLCGVALVNLSREEIVKILLVRTI